MSINKLKQSDDELPPPRPSISYEEGLKLLQHSFTSQPARQNHGIEVHEGKVVVDIGQVRRITLPSGWEAGPVRELVVGHSYYQAFMPPGDEEVKLFFFYRGIPLAATTASSFHDMLEQSPHSLGQHELERISALLPSRGNPEDFVLADAHTQDLGGKRVLNVSGRYIEDDKEMVALLIDADDTGSVVQEIEYQAPADKFQQYLPAARRSFASICWK